MSDDFSQTLEKCKQIVYFFSTSKDITEFIRAIKINNQIVGFIAAFFETGIHCKNAEISYWLNCEYRGNGYQQELIRYLLDFAKTEHFNAITLTTNIPDTTHIYQKIGFKMISNKYFLAL